MGRVPVGATAFANRTSPYVVNCIARTPDVDALPLQQKWAQAARDAMATYGNGGIYVNFTGDSNADIVRKSYPPETYARLQRVKHRYDPQNVFRFNQNVSPRG